nr:hypothetical protein [Burkholderia sp. BDU5]
MGANFLSSWIQGDAQRTIGQAQTTIDNANTYSQNTINQANADAANAVRAANNGFAAAQAALSNLTRSIGNQAKLEAGGKAEDALTTNILRLQDQAVHGSLESQLRSAEQLGAVRAAAAAAGVGGSTARMLQNTMQLTAARAQTAADQNTQYQTYDMLQQKMGLVQNKIMSLDEGQTFAPIDYNINVAPLVQSPIRASQFASSAFGSSLLGTLASNTGAIANLFGGSGSGGGVGDTSNYSSGNVLNGLIGSVTDAVKQFGNLGGSSNGFFSTASGSKLANFQLS